MRMRYAVGEAPRNAKARARRAGYVVGEVDGRAVRCAELGDRRAAGRQQPARGDAQGGAAVSGRRIHDVGVTYAAVGEHRHRVRHSTGQTSGAAKSVSWLTTSGRAA